jgi:hypothetical protein
MIRWLLLGFVLLNVSCSNWLTRQGCNKVNWFQHAYDTAMQGKRLEESPRYKECTKAETEINAAEVDRGFKAGMENYCKPDTAYAKGAAGEATLNYDFCDSNLGPRMKKRYMEGLNRFCQPDAAYTFGSTGGVYKNQCPKDMEAAFVAKFRKGRALYLKNQIASNEAQIAGFTDEIREQQSKRYETSARLASLPRTHVTQKTKQFDPVTKTYKEVSSTTESPEIARQREDLNRELKSIGDRIQTIQSDERKLREQIHQYRAEMESLNN